MGYELNSKRNSYEKKIELSSLCLIAEYGRDSRYQQRKNRMDKTVSKTVDAIKMDLK
jgi:hypothetical protein